MLEVGHTIKVGEIIASLGEQVAIADTHEVWQLSEVMPVSTPSGKFVIVGEATIRILPDGDEHCICTNEWNIHGVVCFLPSEFKGCAILKVKVTKIHNKSVEATPLDYIKGSEPFEFYCNGRTISEIMTYMDNHAERITAQGGK